MNLRKLPVNVWIVTLTSFLTDISSEMIFNLLPLFLSNVLGVSTSTIGLIEGIAEATASLLKGVSGWFSDKLGQRKWLTVAGYSLSALVKPFLYGVSAWGGVLAVRFTDRVGKGIRTAPRDALIADSIDPQYRGAAFGLHRAGDTAGAMIGLIVALGIVLATQSDALTLSRDTFQTLVLVSMIPAFLAVVVLAAGAHEVPIQKKAQPAGLRFQDLNPRFRSFL
ncbi:MAG: MFS transporter, partial [Anaerolineae bacterium]|nr:MFS transporter [Anaerolineae bacterium]